jgi:putative radical SAM enzyme (TIGR03279 family)
LIAAGKDLRISAMVTVKSVNPGSFAEKAGILPGDILLTVNGNKIRDVLDYRFYTTEKKLSVLLHRGPDLITVEITKGEYDDPGLDFETFLMDKKQTCRNKCIFCFIDQNPKGMRDTIYFKDDDSRLSFLMGNYITLTNMTDEDIDRIIKMRMSPINISVHTTNPELRCKMLCNRFAGSTLPYIKRLVDGGITVNAQIVLCKGINDGDELIRTLGDLGALYPGIGSVAVVPAGITAHREGLFELEPFGKEDAAAAIDIIDSFGDRYFDRYGVRLFYPSDEFFITAGHPLPDESYYDGYPQIENGVGMITSMNAEFGIALDGCDENIEKPFEFSIATGTAAYGFIKSITKRMCEKVPNLHGTVYPIENDFFGHTITVSGLICGCDLIKQLKGKKLGERLFVSSTMLRDEGNLFLDDRSKEDVENALNIKITEIDSDGFDFVDKIIDEAKSRNT